MKQNWWEDFFEDSFAEFFLNRNEKSLKEYTSFLMNVLELEKGMTLFDQCSGLGNISHELARNGVKTIGVDQNAEYIKVAKKVAEEEGLPCDFFQADAVTFLPYVPCDAAISLYTSFGYSLNDATNVEMLKRIYECLRVGGSFVLEFHNLFFNLRQPLSNILIKKNPEGKECTVTRTSSFDLENGAYLSKWTYTYPDGTQKEREGTTRIYLPHELKDMLISVGFKNVYFYGGLDKSPLTIDSPYCFLIAKK